MTHMVEQWQGTDPSGGATQEFRIRRQGARDVTGVYWLPEGANVSGLLCFGHGASGDRYQQPVLRLVELLTRNNIAVLALDGPDHGLRQQGEGGRIGMVRDLSREQALDEMNKDWDEAIKWLQQTKELGELPLAYFGLSMGTAYGLGVVRNQADMKCAVLGLWGAMPQMPHNDDFVATARSISCPLLFLAQSDDEFVPLAAYCDFFQAFGSPNKRMHANPGVHAEIPHDEVVFAAEFITQILLGEGPSIERPMLPIVDVVE